MTVTELHELLKSDLIAIRLQVSALADLQAKSNAELPVLKQNLADVRETVYHPETGLQRTITVVAERQRKCQEGDAPGNMAERRNNWLALGALLVAVITMILMILQIGGCTLMPKKMTHLNNLDQVDSLEDYAGLKKEITALVKTIGKNARLELTGDRTYDVEADGSIYMVHADQRRPVSTWRASDEWQYFREDVKHNRLLQRLQALK